MAEQRVDLQVSFFDPALERLERIEHALHHVGKAVELELADVALDPSTLTDDVKAKLQEIGGSLLRIVQTGQSVAGDIFVATGDEPVEVVAQAPAAPAPRPSVGQTRSRRRSPSTASTHRPATPSPRRDVSPPADGSEPVAPVAEAQESEQGLYARIIKPEETPEMRRAEGARKIDVTIVADDRVKIGDREIVLGNHERFLFNALMMLREEPRAGAEIRELGFFPEATNGKTNATFSTSMRNLSELLNTAAGVELIKKVGAGQATRYCVNPNLVLEEGRTEDTVVTAEGGSQLKKN